MTIIEKKNLDLINQSFRSCKCNRFFSDCFAKMYLIYKFTIEKDNQEKWLKKKTNIEKESYFFENNH